MSAPSVEFWDSYVHKINSFMYSGRRTFSSLSLPRKRALLSSPRPHARTGHSYSASGMASYLVSPGTSGFLAFLAFRIVFPLLHLGWIRKAILARMSKDEFVALCHKHDKQIQVRPPYHQGR